ncbi:MAG: hypothetical protein GC156_15585 [Actinomycetales bacterium]|nr:hypothetical protein [Actinomycetales bacterium]
MRSLTRLTVVAAALMVLSGLIAVAPAQAAPSKDRYAVGDSVMLGARTALRARGFAVDAAVSRQAYVGPSLIRKKGSKLPQNVVVHLGTNGTFPLDTCRRLVKAAGPERRVFLVTVFVPRSWENSNNATIRQCAKSFPDGRVTVVDWNAVAQKNPSWFYQDHTHLKPTGARAFARLLNSSVDAAIARSGGTAGSGGKGAAATAPKATILGASGTAKVGLNS